MPESGFLAMDCMNCELGANFVVPAGAGKRASSSPSSRTREVV
jgi:hypothetical protein